MPVKNSQPKETKPVNTAIGAPKYEFELTLDATTKLMLSPDYKERFIAEYAQTKIRYEKLKHLLTRWEAFPDKQRWECNYKSDSDIKYEMKDWLGFEPSCSFELLKRQQEAMAKVLHILELRAAIEGINLRLVTIKL